MITHWFRFFTAKLLLELFSALIVFGVVKLILMPFAVITLASVMNVYIVFTILNLVFAGCYARDGNRLAEIGAGTQAAVTFCVALVAWIGS